jgi:outer membrane protein
MPGKINLLRSSAISLMAVFMTPVSLPEAVQHALQFDPAIAEANAILDREKAGISAAQADRLVTIGVKGQVGVTETDFTTGSISQNPQQIGLQAEMPIYQSGALRASIDASKSAAFAAENNLEGANEKIALATVEAYANAWLAERIYEVSGEQVKTFEIRLEETRSRMTQGLVTKTDIALTEARLASSQARRGANQASLISTQAKLARLTGISEPRPATEFNHGLPLPASFDDAMAEVLQANPDLAAAKAMASSAGYRVQQTKGQFGPKVTLSARAARTEESYFFFNQPVQDVGAFVGFEMPLITSGLRSAKIREARAGAAQAQAGARRAELQLREAVASLWGNLQARRQSLNAAIRAENAARLAAEGAQKEYEAGIRTLVEALDAENDYRDAQIARYREHVALFIAEARLLSLSSNLENTIAP